MTCLSSKTIVVGSLLQPFSYGPLTTTQNRHELPHIAKALESTKNVLIKPVKVMSKLAMSMKRHSYCFKQIYTNFI